MRTLGIVSWAAVLVLATVPLLRADDQAEVKAVVDRAIKAEGGAKNLARFRAATMKFKGKFYVSDNAFEFTGEMAVQYPGQQKLTVMGEVMGNSFSVTRVVDKDKGWVKMGNDVKAMPKDELAEEREQLYAREVARLIALQGKGFQLSPIGEIKVGKHETVGIKVSHKGHRDINMYFDKKSGLLLKTEMNVKNPMTGAEVSQETYFEEYKKIEGAMRPMKMKIKQDGKNFLDLDEFSDVKMEEKLDNSEFAKP